MALWLLCTGPGRAWSALPCLWTPARPCGTLRLLSSFFPLLRRLAESSGQSPQTRELDSLFGRGRPFAGIYHQWKGPTKKDGDNVDIEVFLFMTTLPNALTSTINHERSPVLLTEEAQFATWLTGTPEQAMGLITTSDLARMRIVQSGFEKKDLLEAA